jgi:hypothetical protein
MPAWTSDPNVWTAIFTGLTVLVGAAAAWASILVYLEQKRAQEPIIELDEERSIRQGTRHFRVVVRNRSTSGLRLRKLCITRPKGVKVGEGPPGADGMTVNVKIPPLGSVHRSIQLKNELPREPIPADYVLLPFWSSLPRSFTGEVRVEVEVERSDRAAKRRTTAASMWIAEETTSNQA